MQSLNALSRCFKSWSNMLLINSLKEISKTSGIVQIIWHLETLVPLFIWKQSQELNHKKTVQCKVVSSLCNRTLILLLWRQDGDNDLWMIGGNMSSIWAISVTGKVTLHSRIPKELRFFSCSQLTEILFNLSRENNLMERFGEVQWIEGKCKPGNKSGQLQGPKQQQWMEHLGRTPTI